jgi:phage shock protein C
MMETRRMENPRPRLTRSRTDRMVGGVCGGLAAWGGWDPTLVRLGFVFVSILSAAFPGLLVYLVMWVITPLADT